MVRLIVADRDRCVAFCRKNTIGDDLASKYSIQKAPFDQVIKRPEISIDDITAALATQFDSETIRRSIIEIRYEGYIKRQERQIDKLEKMNKVMIPSSIDYDTILGLRTESRDKLKRFKPKTILDAKKIAGINPADLMLVCAHVR